MRYCHECGAETAPDDAFCAFCGIVLNPVPFVSQPQNVNETIVNSSPASNEFGAPDWSESETNISAADFDEEEEPQTVLRKTPVDALRATEEQQIEASDGSLDAAANSLPGDDSAKNADSENELQIATVPNIELESFAHEADVPFEEIREDEILASEATPASQEPEEHLTSATAIKEKTLFQTVEEKVSANEALTLETEAYGRKLLQTEQQSRADAAAASQNLKSKDSVSEKELQQTLISQPLAEKSAVIDELISNPNDPSVPRPTSNQQSLDTGSKSPKLKPLNVNTILNNRYEIVRRIGGGGMGAVYLANDRNLGGVQRAVKEMIQSYVDEAQHEKALQDFRRESLMLSALEHPAIPTIYDYFVDEKEGRFYLVMKYISGGDLAARFRSAPEGIIDEISMTEWAAQIADVLDYLHNHEPPIVYRDLKPSNIMIDGKTGRIMLVDFGIARWVNKEEKGNTAVGTMGYAPSEQYAGNAEPRSDIYALGATMFHLLTGADPQNNPLLIFDFTKNPRPRQINPNLSVEIEKIIVRAVEYNASLRYSSAAEMRAVLLEHLDRARAGRLTFAAPEFEVAPATLIPSATSMAFCGFCGERIASNDMFCAFCGTKQPEAERVHAAANAAFPDQKPSARLVLETGAFEEPAFVLEKESNLVGREDRRSNIFPEIDLTKFDIRSQISRRHARIWRQGANYLIEDLGSSNGTTLVLKDNQTVRLLAHQPHVIMHGDKLKLGETTLHFYTN